MASITIAFKANEAGDLHIRAFGETYPVRQNFKAHGYTWHGGRSVWEKTVSGADAIKAEAVWIKAELTNFAIVRG